MHAEDPFSTKRRHRAALFVGCLGILLILGSTFQMVLLAQDPSLLSNLTVDQTMFRRVMPVLHLILGFINIGYAYMRLRPPAEA